MIQEEDRRGKSLPVSPLPGCPVQFGQAILSTMKRPTGFRFWLVVGLLVFSIGGQQGSQYVQPPLADWFNLIGLIAGITLALLVLAKFVSMIPKEIREIQEIRENDPSPDTESETTEKNEDSSTDPLS